MKNVGLTIDGETVTVPAGLNIMDAADRQGVFIPRLCHHPELKPFGACRLCLVEDEKTGRLMASCVTPVAQDMVVNTKTPRVLRHRSNIIRLMIAEHPESCIVCNKGNRCRLRHEAARMGIGESRLYPMPNIKSIEEANPFILRDLSKCILCGKCIRADHELVMVGAIDYNLRGFRSRPATVHNTGLETSNCTFCGTCVSICPTGALSPAYSAYVGTAERESDSVCGFCGVGCRLSIGAVDNKVVEINPSTRSDTVNKATLCVRGHFAHDFLNSGRRLNGPLIRKENESGATGLAPASWDDALNRVAHRLLDIRDLHGSQSIAFIGSSKCTNEENYLLQKIARARIGTSHIDNGGYVSGQEMLLYWDAAIGGRWRKNALEKLEAAEAVLIIGTDVCTSVPVLSYHLKRASRRNIPILMVDPLENELTRFTTFQLRIRPESDLELLNGLAALLHGRNASDSAFLDQHAENLNMFRYALSSYDLPRVCRLTGLAMETIEKAADLLKGKKISVVLGQGLLRQRYGRHAVGALLNLALMTGSLGSEKAGFYVAAKENNLIGSMDMGTVPNHLPGRGPMASEAVRTLWESAWGVSLPREPGLSLPGIIEKAERGELKALYVMGENPVRALPQSDRVRKALQNLEFLVVQDILETETTVLADVVLSGAAFSEKAGTFTNLEGRIQGVAAVVTPPGRAKPDWEILDLLSEKLGGQAPYGSVESIGKEIKQFIPAYADLRIAEQGWIKSAESVGSESPGRISFAPVAATEELSPGADYPLTAILGGRRYHLGSGTRTAVSPRIGMMADDGGVEISPSDAKAIGIIDGDRLTVSSPHGTLERPARLNKRIPPGHLFVPTGVCGNAAMSLIGFGDAADRGGEGWKTCPVKIGKL